MNQQIYSPICRAKFNSVKIADYSANEILKALNEYTVNSYADYCEAGELVGRLLKKHFHCGLLDFLQEFAAGNGSALLLKGLPVSAGVLPPTPLTDDGVNGKDNISELFLIGLAWLLGCIPFLNPGEKNLAIVHQVLPIPGRENELSGVGSAAAFLPHTENPHCFNSPNFIALSCLKGDKNAITSFYGVDDLIYFMPNWVKEQLLREIYIFRTGPSYYIPQQSPPTGILSIVDGQYNIRYNSSIDRLIVPQDDKLACSAVDFLVNWLDKYAIKDSVTLEAGDCLILNNRRALHGRSGFAISTSVDERRWIQRIYMIKMGLLG